MTRCWKCDTNIEEKILFRTACASCGSDQHVCKNCRHYTLGKPNDCAVPCTEWVRDREEANFCEEFSPRTSLPSSKDPLEKAKRLFGEEPPKKKNPLLDERVSTK